MEEEKGNGILGLIIIGFMLTSCGMCSVFLMSDSEDSQPAVASTRSASGEKAKKAPQAKALEVLDHEYGRSRYGSTTITGRVKNNSSRKYSYVQISFNLYNGAGELIGSAMDNVNGLEPGGTWRFEAVILEGQTTSYKLNEVGGW